MLLLFTILHALIFQVEEESYNNKSHEEEEACNTFAQFGLNPQIIKILENYRITRPLKIQTIGIPQIMNGVNAVIAAETGCGKTLTYLLPMIDNILRWKKLVGDRYNSPLGLIVTPTRELAFQIGVCIIIKMINQIIYNFTCL